ncbi:cardiolipin synthase [Paenibacillus sp. HN-1]|uniref:cardiolipin synthase n=1 Tax=Paenibacillus sp. CGMCC 1.18879 TaxID=2834466 RepID=UPI001CA8E5BC|nr:cardiolipin synthase [Paenibacillus sp. CGMCC 1.18879]MBY9080596.1 cardiolipin synthase [Paenibacillus sp. CGMCC 1.18879]MBY9085459.1 cardiolipin synthase [Paenibacillus sinensis]
MLWAIAALFLEAIQIIAIVIFELRRPYKAITWVVVAAVLPLIGYVLYFFIGKEYADKRPDNPEDKLLLEQVREQLSDRGRRKLTEECPDAAASPNGSPGLKPGHTAALPVTAGNKTAVFSKGEQAFEDMLRAIASARHHIHIEFYIIRDDHLGSRFQQLLIRKAREGVKVKLIYDGIGCLKLKKSFVNRLHEAGAETGCFSPPFLSFFTGRLNYRNHRKIVVVDGRIGYFGGLNIGDEYLGRDPKIGYWRDTHFRIEGDAVGWIQFAFLTDWYFVKRVLLTDPDYYPLQEGKGKERVRMIKSGPDEPIHELFFSCFASAKRRIYIESPYFVLEPGIILALRTAAVTGVDVRIILPAVPDSKFVHLASMSYVQELLQAGVRFYLYEKGFLHAKVIIADDLACSGSANMDIRSFYGQFELHAIFYDGTTVDRLVHDFDRDLQESREIELSQYAQRPQIQKYKETIARLFSPLL